jgi:hypothetical protein
VAVSLATEIGLAPQAKTVLLHLVQRRSISPMEAMVTYGITRLAARIHDLRSSGYAIEKEMRRDAAGKPYARYHLEA